MRKIALILDHFFPHKGGAESAVYQLACFLRQKNYEVHILTQSYDPSLEELFSFHVLKVRSKIGWLRILSFGWKVGKEVNKHSFDQVLGFNKTWRGMNYFQPHGGTTRASRMQNVRVYRYRYERLLKQLLQFFSFKQWIFLWIETQQYRNAHCTFLALSQMVKTHMQTFYHVPEERIQVIYNGVDVERFHPQERSKFRASLEQEFPQCQGKVLFLFVAHNFKLKGLNPLIEAFGNASLDRKKFLLLILGRGRQQSYLRLAQKWNLAENLLFLKEDPDPEKYFCAVDAFVHPTFYDPCSLVLLEAMAAGLPCLTSRWNGAGELLKHKQSGLIINDPWNISEMALALEKLMNPEVRQSLGSAARAIAEQIPWESSFEKIEQVFQQRSARK
ncbi:MAG: glycosyltransferase family 4 protein [Planctomycetota bacterium]